MCDHNLLLGKGWNGHFTDGWGSILLSFRHSDLLADGLEVAGSVLFLRRSRWTLCEISECISNEEILISLNWKNNTCRVNLGVNLGIEEKDSKQGINQIESYFSIFYFFRYKRDTMPLCQAGVRVGGSLVHWDDWGSNSGRDGVGIGGGGGSNGGGEKGGGRHQDSGSAGVLRGGVVVEVEEVLHGPDLLHRGGGGDTHLGEVVPVHRAAVQEAILLEDHGFPTEMLVIDGLVTADSDTMKFHQIVIDKLVGEQSVVRGVAVLCVKPEKEKINFRLGIFGMVYRSRMGELGFLLRRQTWETSLIGKMKLNFLCKMLMVLVIRSSTPLLGVMPSPVSMTVLKGTYKIWITEKVKVILPNSFFALGLKETVVAVFLVGVDLLGQLGLLVREGRNLLGKCVKGRHGGEMKVYLGLHSIRCEIFYYRHLGIKLDQYKDLNLLLVEETHEVRRTTFQETGKKKKTGLIRTYISGFKIFFVFYFVN